MKSRKQDTQSRKPDASPRRTQQWELIPEKLSPEDREELKGRLERTAVKNIKIYPGTWKAQTKTIFRVEGANALQSFDAPSDLLAWLAAGNVQGPLVIEAELPPLAQTQGQLSDYQKEMERVRALRDIEGSLMYDRAWPSVRRLAAIEKELPYTHEPIKLEEDREKLRKSLWENYPQYAERLGLRKLVTTPTMKPAEKSRRVRQSAGVGAKLKQLIATVAKQNPTYSQRQICGRVDDVCDRARPKQTALLPTWKEAGATSLTAAFDSSILNGRVKKFISTALRKASL